MENTEQCLPVASSSTNGAHEEGRGCRSKRKQVDPSCCPVCSITLRPSEADSHLASEIDKLYKLSSSRNKLNGKNCSVSTPTVNGSGENGLDKSWETYQKVKSNRQSRQRVKSRKRKVDEVVCPVCNKETSEDINIHVEKCLRRSENSEAESDENIDVEGFEEYEWAGQSRVRATSLLEGGVSSLGTSISMTEEDEELIVDGDDTQTYGSPQYSEKDIVRPTEDSEPCTADSGKDMGDPIIEVLKKRITELESKEHDNEIYKCLICMERYKTPVVSVCCWHVHCEQCWLHTLGVKKLCPQCNMITSPSDLRRVYM